MRARARGGYQKPSRAQVGSRWLRPSPPLAPRRGGCCCATASVGSRGHAPTWSTTPPPPHPREDSRPRRASSPRPKRSPTMSRTAPPRRRDRARDRLPSAPGIPAHPRRSPRSPRPPPNGAPVPPRSKSSTIAQVARRVVTNRARTALARRAALGTDAVAYLLPVQKVKFRESITLPIRRRTRKSLKTLTFGSC